MPGKLILKAKQLPVNRLEKFDDIAIQKGTDNA